MGGLNVCACVYMYICMCSCVFLCFCVCTCTHASTCVCMCVHVHMCVYVNEQAKPSGSTTPPTLWLKIRSS